MAWTETTRRQYRRDELRYASDLKDGEWEVIAPLMPEPSLLGRPREVDLRAVVNAIFYILSTGCQWRALPKDFPPRSTVQGYFYRWRDDAGVLQITEQPPKGRRYERIDRDTPAGIRVSGDATPDAD